MSKPYSELIDWLKSRGAADVKCGDGFLLDHLEDVYHVLSIAKQPMTLCLAGLFHPVYDVKIFEAGSVALSDRGVIKNLIGTDAEDLVWMFCKMNRPTALMQFCEDPEIAALPLLDGTEMAIHENDRRVLMPQMLTIECASYLEHQILWRNQWLVPHAKLIGLISADGDELGGNEVEAHMAQMLAQAKQALILELVEGINFKRKSLASSYHWGDNLRVMKAKQAQSLIQAKGEAVLAGEIGLVSHYAKAYGVSLLDAAQDITARADAFQARLVETEMLKDSLMAEISGAQNFEDIERIRAVLDEKA